jgi:hypothetical protein
MKKITDKVRLDWVEANALTVKRHGTFYRMVPLLGFALLRNGIDAAIEFSQKRVSPRRRPTKKKTGGSR